MSLFWTESKRINRANAENEASKIGIEYTSKNNTPFNRCVDLDRRIKRYDVLISDLSTKNIKGNAYGDLIRKYSTERLELQKPFVQQDCKNTIEFEKLEESADILGEGFSQYELDILEKSRKEQNRLYVIGAVVIVFGAYLIFR